MPRLFGTDGVRGLANGETITADFALRLAQAAARVLRDPQGTEGRRPVAVVGRDPRASGEFLSAAVVAGLASSGIDVLDAGVVPTPALAFLTSEVHADFGVMLSASHNAMPDNGIKFFAVGGHKLPDAVEDAIQAAMDDEPDRPTGIDVGRVTFMDDAGARYVRHLLDAVEPNLRGLTIVLDAAHGAASQVSPEVFRLAGAEVHAIGARPDGLNINDGCGSTHLESLQAAVVEHGAHLGIAHDGDADRCLAVDASGEPIDGDQIMAILALALKEKGELAENTLVATVMSNLGLLRAMESAGIEVKQTGVGDRYVLEEMRRGGYSLGGEQSGHLIMLEHATTGDGVLTGLMLAARVAETGQSLAQLAAAMTRMPQVLINVKDVDKDRVDGDEGVRSAVADEESSLGMEGRVLLRKSGTEPVVRVMVEAATEERARTTADRLSGVVKERLSL
ncbi:phosphoglucosamine mutase [Janibacter cremeus]|uniref:phosphoglucosamine mutase n=1 Tax=Janibacter cremeus TaxID=1285192 RepID=UPI0023F6BB24|nr:phosphoglucosamine mutase [Janibacter cremeus]WEV78007.1 phosphoglucosamine mutase [Janibacter cremeus]